jgi:hypothetical protein
MEGVLRGKRGTKCLAIGRIVYILGQFECQEVHSWNSQNCENRPVRVKPKGGSHESAADWFIGAFYYRNGVIGTRMSKDALLGNIQLTQR